MRRSITKLAITLIWVTSLCLTASAVEALNLSDYYPLHEDDEWFYKETDTFAGGSQTFVSTLCPRHRSVSYGPSSFNGFKLFETEADGHIDHSVSD